MVFLGRVTSMNHPKEGVHALIFSDCMTTMNTWARSSGAYRIATHLREMGLRVQVVDYWAYLNIEAEELTELLIEKFVGSETLFVGFASTFFNWRLLRSFGYRSTDKVGFYTSHVDSSVMCTTEARVQAIRDKVKSINPKTDLMLAGARASRKVAGMDVVVFGYGERHIEDYVKWKKGKNPFFQGTRDEHGRTILEYNTTAAGLDFGKTTIRWNAEDCVQPGESLPIEISRGCIFRCSFCSFPLNGRAKNDYLKESEVLAGEFIRNYELYGTTKYMFADDTYNDTNTKLEWMNEVVSRLPFTLEFATYGRLDLIAKFPEQIQLIQQNGCTSMTFGIESLNQKAAAAIGKGGKTERLIETLYRMREVWGNKVHTSAGFILGLPYDTYDTMEAWTDRLIDPRFPLHNPLFVPLGITNAKTTEKKFVSDFDKDPGKFGYVLNSTGWVNDTYGTSLDGCEYMGKSMVNYMTKQGRDHYGSHVLIGVEDETLSREQSLVLGAYGVARHYAMGSRTYQRYLNYMHDILNLPEF